MAEELIPAFRDHSGLATRASVDVRQDVSSYLRRAGWAPMKRGRFGELWHLANVDIAVPFELEASSPEFALIVRRIAEVEDRDPGIVLVSVEREFQDIQSYRISDRFMVDDAVLLETAATVMTGARRLVRAAATTARRPRPNIGSNYSHPADALAGRARLAHTREGSFVLPVVMPVDPPEPGQDEIALGDGMVIEPGERRVTRTLATALAALDSIAVRSATEPTADGIYELVQRGVSREIVAAVRVIASDPGVHAFDATFAWAPGLGDPGRIPDRVVISRDAAPLLSRLEDRLAETPPDENQTVSGPIINIRHLPGDPYGDISVHAVRNSRIVEVRISVAEDIIQQAYDWAKQRRALIARGAIVIVQGRVSIPEPDHVGPMDQLFVLDDLS